MKHAFITLFERDLDRLHREIATYSSDAALWELRPGISNSAGNLALHLCGNLGHFIGATLGNTGYVRDRDSEFTTKDLSVAQLLEQIGNTQSVVLKTLNDLSDGSLNAPYPLEPLGYPMTVDYFLLHLSGHLNYHLGQINYHRRLTTN
jgi:uncharacterized damage-inducible protein DinB